MAVLALQNVPGCRYIRFFKWSKISRCMFYIFTPLESNMKQILLWSSYWWKIKQLRSVPDRLQIKRNISQKQAFDSLFAIMVDIEHEKAIIGITSFLKYTICTTQLHEYPKKRLLKISVCVLFPCLLSRLVNICSESFCFISFMTLLNNLIQHQILMCNCVCQRIDLIHQCFSISNISYLCFPSYIYRLSS